MLMLTICVLCNAFRSLHDAKVVLNSVCILHCLDIIWSGCILPPSGGQEPGSGGERPWYTCSSCLTLHCQPPWPPLPAHTAGAVTVPVHIRTSCVQFQPQTPIPNFDIVWI